MIVENLPGFESCSWLEMLIGRRSWVLLALWLPMSQVTFKNLKELEMKGKKLL